MDILGYRGDEIELILDGLRKSGSRHGEKKPGD
jgi:hypothetical protein